MLVLCGMACGQILNPSPAGSGPVFRRGGLAASNPGAGGGGGGGSWAFHGDSINKTCASSTTCSVTLSPSVLSASLLIVDAWTVNNTPITGIGACGTLVQLPSVGGTAGGTTFHSWGYVQAASATAGPCVASFGATNGGGDVEIREWTAGGGTPVLDALSVIFNTFTASPIVGPTLTLAGASDALFETENNDNALTTSCGSPWNTNTNFDATNGPGFCDNVATASGTGASFTTTAAGTKHYVAAGLGFGFSISPCALVSIDDHSGGVSGNAVTAAGENSSTFNTLFTGGWTATASTTGMLWSNTNGQALANPVRVCGTGTTKGGSSAMGVTYQDNTATLQNLTLSIDPSTNGWGQVVGSVGFAFKTACSSNVCGVGGVYSPGRIDGFNGGFAGFAVNAMVTRFETDNAIVAGSFTLVTGTWYWVTLKYAATGTHEMRVYDISGTSLKDTITQAGSGLKGNPTDFVYGRVGEPGATTNLDAFGNIKICWDGTYPCLP